jgi:hypothetical protein
MGQSSIQVRSGTAYPADSTRVTRALPPHSHGTTDETSVAFVGTREVISHIESCIVVDHFQWSGMACRQALAAVIVDPEAVPGHGMWKGTHGSVQIQLSDGRLFLCRFRGNANEMMARIHEISSYLAHCDIHSTSAASAIPMQGSAPEKHNFSLPSCTIDIETASEPLPWMMPSSETLVMQFRHWLDRPCLGLQTPPSAGIRRALDICVSKRVASYRVAREAFSMELDQSAMDVVSGLASRFGRRYNDVRIYNFLVAGAKQGTHYRCQAIEALPWLVHAVCGIERIHSLVAGDFTREHSTKSETVATIVHAIDAGKPLLEATARAFGVTTETIKWTRGKMLPVFRKFDRTSIEVLLSFLSWLPVEKRPMIEEEWECMNEVVRTLLLAVAPCWKRDEMRVMEVPKEAGKEIVGQWLRDLLRPDLQGARQWLLRLAIDGRDPASIRDFMQALINGMHRRLEDHCMSDDHHREQLLEWLGSTSFFELLGLSCRWHAALESLSAKSPEPDRVGASIPDWPTLLKKPIRMDRFTFSELTNGKELLQEGTVMRHCVGTYAERCLQDGVVVLSVSDEAGARVSTAALSVRDTQPHVVQIEHKGLRNTPVMRDSDEALSKLVRTLNGDEYRTLVATRLQFCRGQKRRHLLDIALRERRSDHYHRAAEDMAWNLAFGER